MTVGTKSVLYGAHAFWLHPWFVAWGWWRLYGFPWDPRLWVAFFVHDLGYIGKPNMDGPEGESHPILGARIMAALFDRSRRQNDDEFPVIVNTGRRQVLRRWGKLSLLHSRFYAGQVHMDPSRLCYADKLAIVLTPWWLYMPMVRATGELDEYMALAEDAWQNRGKYAGEWRSPTRRPLTPKVWHTEMTTYMAGWLDEEFGVDIVVDRGYEVRITETGETGKCRHAGDPGNMCLSLCGTMAYRPVQAADWRRWGVTCRRCKASMRRRGWARDSAGVRLP